MPSHANDEGPWYAFLPKRGDFTIRCQQCSCIDKDYTCRHPTYGNASLHFPRAQLASHGEWFKKLLEGDKASSAAGTSSTPDSSLDSIDSASSSETRPTSTPWPKSVSAAVSSAKLESRDSLHLKVSALSVAALFCALYDGDKGFFFMSVEIENLVEAMELAALWGVSEKARATLLMTAIGCINGYCHTGVTLLEKAEYHNYTRLFVEAYRHGYPTALMLQRALIDYWREQLDEEEPIRLPELKFERSHIADIGRKGVDYWKKHVKEMESAGFLEMVKQKKERVQRVIVPASWVM